MPDGPAEFQQYRDTYSTASTRLRRHIGMLAHARGVPVTIELGPNRASTSVPAIHTVTLAVRKREAVVYIDHESFMADDDVFRHVVIPKINAAIDTLAAA